MYTTHRRQFVLLGAAGALLQQVSVAAATDPANAGNRAGTVDLVSGSAHVSDAGASRKLTQGMVIYGGQSIETDKDSEVHLVFDDGGFLAVRPQSRVSIDQVKMAGAYDDSLAMTLLRGALRSITGWVGKFDKRSYQLTAGTTTVGIRGTDHEVLLLPESEAKPGEIAGIHSWVNSGGTTLKNESGSMDVDPGQAAWASHDGKKIQMHEGGVPQFLHRWKLRSEARVNRHSMAIRQHIEQRMRARGMIKNNEHLEDAMRQHRQLLQQWRRQFPQHAKNDRGPLPHKGFGEWLQKRKNEHAK